MFDDLVDANLKIDLAINTLSFTEMSEKQMQYYAQKLKKMLSDTGLLFEQNGDNRPGGFCYPKVILCDYFMFKDAIPYISAPVKYTPGEGDIWANRRISEIINPSLKPFGGVMWGIRKWNIRLLKPGSKVWVLKGFTRKLIGVRFYNILVGWRNRILHW